MSSAVPSVESLQSELLFTRTTAGVMAGIALIGLSTGCKAEPPDLVVPTTSPSPKYIEPLDPEVGPCADARYLTDMDATVAAQRCFTAMQGGRLALVTYGVPSKTANEVAKKMQDSLVRATGSLAKISITVIPASAAAKDAFEEATAPDDCIDHMDNETYLANAADDTMPELNDYDFVMGFSNTQFCFGEVVGSADPEDKGRYTDLSYASVKDWQNIWGGTHKELVEKLAVSGAHEVGHLLRLAHAGTVTGWDSKGIYIDPREAAKNGTFNLGAFLKLSRFNNLGAGPKGDLMGNDNSDVALVPNPIEQEILRWPNIVIDGQSASFVESLNAEWSSISAGDARVGKVIMTRLQHNVYYDGDGNFHDTYPGGSGSTSFDSLAIIAKVNEEGRITGFELMLFDTETNKTGTLGVIGEIGKNSPTENLTVDYGGMQFQVELSNESLRAKRLEA